MEISKLRRITLGVALFAAALAVINFWRDSYVLLGINVATSAFCFFMLWVNRDLQA